MGDVRLPVFTVQIEGISMLPALAPGEWWLGLRTRGIATGDLVVFTTATDRSVRVKRAVRAEAGGWWVEGDNAGASVDSRHDGLIPAERIIGRLWWRYRPWSVREVRAIRRNARG
jgi:signal peptidase I